jgi:hypothetical protein
MVKKANKVGRPKLPKGHAKGKIVPVRLNDDDLKLFAKAMKRDDHKTLSGWLRHVARESAEK